MTVTHGGAGVSALRRYDWDDASIGKDTPFDKDAHRMTLLLQDVRAAFRAFRTNRRITALRQD